MRPKPLAWIPVLLLVAFLSACGGTGAGDGAQGKVSIALTDAPGFEFDNVWITVRRVWFHKVADAPFDPSATGWVRFTLDNAVTVNLAALSNGNVRTVWDNLSLPVGTYRQILLFLEPTEDPPVKSAVDNALLFNNQVDAGTLHAPLRIPNPVHGIRLAGTFQIAESSTLRLAIDFDVGHDVVQITRGGEVEYILKPRLRVFNLGNAGAIVGFVDNVSANDNTAFFVVKAEQIDAAGGVRVVRRATSIDNTGKFVLFPVAPGNYDVLIRGFDYNTVIVRNVPATAGTSPSSSPTVVGTPITMQKSTADYLVTGTLSPTGSWIRFYQSLPGDPFPYEIRFRHANPFSGNFTGFRLSSAQLRVGPYAGGGTVSLVLTTPTEGLGNYTAFADALLYNRSTGVSVSPVPGGAILPLISLTPAAPALQQTVTGRMTVPAFPPPPAGISLDNGIILILHGGLVVDALQRSAAEMGTGFHPYSIGNLPGNFPGAVYGVASYGWSITDNVFAVGTPNLADLRFGPDTAVNMTMVRIF